jgi:hypothetical protein
MEGIRHAWKILTFSSAHSSPSRPRSATGETTNDTSRFSRRRPRRLSLHRACSLPVSSLPPAGKPGRCVRPGAYEITKTQGAPRHYRVIIPIGTEPGSDFTAVVGQQEIQATCPLTSQPGNYVRVTVPGDPIIRQRFLKVGSLTTPQETNPQTLTAFPVLHKKGSFKVWVPPRVQPGMTFVATIKRKQYSITCPENVPRNRKIRVSLVAEEENPMSSQIAKRCGDLPTCPNPCEELDTSITADSSEDETEDVVLRQQQLKYHDGGGWIRRLRPWDGKWEWVRNDNNDDENNSQAYCRRLQLLQSKDSRLPTGTLCLVPVEESLAESILEQEDSHANTISSVQTQPLEEKTEWFRSFCQQVSAIHVNKSIKIVVRREHLLEDSVQAVLSLSPEQLQQPWKFEFVHEPAVDSGGVTREWFQLVSEELFDVDNGLWVMTGTEHQMSVAINPDSGKCGRMVDSFLFFLR